MSKPKKLKASILLFIFLIVAAIYFFMHKSTGGEIAVASISSNGNYAITTDAKNTAILWNIQAHKKIILSHNANMYSAYWIKNTPYYLWQDLKTKQVHITDVTTSKDIQLLHLKFLVYGQVMSSNLKYYAASDVNWNILASSGDYLKLLIKHQNDVPGFEGANKLLNFVITNDGELLSSGFSATDPNSLTDSTGIYLYDLNTMKVIHQFYGNMVQTFATISPDGKYVVSGDMNAWQYIWELKTEKKMFSLLGSHHILKYKKSGAVVTDDNIIIPPKDLYSDVIFSIKYIDNNHYLVFNHDTHYAILYETLNPKPIKYLDLGTTPWPATDALERDQAMDTSPSAHVLVIAKRDGPGIMVYNYNPKTQTLAKVWDAE